MITPRLESGENLFEVLREKFNALADAVDRLDKLASASPLLDVVDMGEGKLIQWNGPTPEPGGAAAEPVIVSGYAGSFAVELVGGTTARIFNGADPSGEYAGEIVVGTTHHNMPAGSVPITPGEPSEIYLTVHYNTGTSAMVYAYATTLSASVTDAQGWYRKLAFVSAAGAVTQVHFGGDVEIAGRWC